jgi:hypothetical protein
VKIKIFLDGYLMMTKIIPIAILTFITTQIQLIMLTNETLETKIYITIITTVGIFLANVIGLLVDKK